LRGDGLGNGKKMDNREADSDRIENAARAAWFYYILGKTQEEIALEMSLSRPTIQRLITLAQSEHLVTFRISHPIAECVDLAHKIKGRFGLKYSDVVPNDEKKADSILGIASAAASFIEKALTMESPIVMAVGTGRTLRAAVEQVKPMHCPQHTLVSVVSNVASDGSASSFDALTQLTASTQARAYPMFLPVLARSSEERQLLLSIHAVQRVHALAAGADITIVGVGQLDFQAQQYVDGFITRDELVDLIRVGAVGEIVGWAYDKDGKILDGPTNSRITSAPHRQDGSRLVVGVAAGPAKVRPIYAAIVGRIVTGLITDAATARAILDIS
jgi:DNA-binding transcriptional regulator LsrR (DeoR family)